MPRRFVRSAGTLGSVLHGVTLEERSGQSLVMLSKRAPHVIAYETCLGWKPIAYGRLL